MATFTIWRQFCDIVAWRGASTAIVEYGASSLTFKQLAQEVDRITALIAERAASHILRHSNERPRVAVVCTGLAHTLATLIAISRVGATAVVVAPDIPPAELRKRLCAAGCSVHVVDGAVEIDRSQINIATDRPLGPFEGDGMCYVDRVSPYYILFTSGTTGEPKGVAQSEANLIEHIQIYLASTKASEQDRITLLFDVSTDAGFMDIFSTLLCGGTVCHWSVHRFGLAGLPGWLRDQRISLLHVTPSLLHALTQGCTNEGIVLQDVRLVVLGGEPCRSSHLSCFDKSFSGRPSLIIGYGPTECTVATQVHYQTVTQFSNDLLGVEVPGIEISIGDTIAPEQIGEIIIISERIALGYISGGLQAFSRFFVDERGRRCYRTGDLGFRDYHGHLYFVGRKDQQVKVNGKFVDCRGIQNAVCAWPGVDSAHVDHDDEGVLSAWLVVSELPFDMNALRAFLSRQAALVPARIHIVDKLPRTYSGKIDVRTLRAAGPRKHACPSTTHKSDYFDRISRFLNMSDYSGRESFRELGGDSLRFLSLIADISRTLGQVIDVDWALFDVPLHTLVDALYRAASAQRSDYEPRRSGDLLTSSEQALWLGQIINGPTRTPRVIYVATLAGVIDPALFELSFRQACRTIPMLELRVSTSSTGQPRWQPTALPSDSSVSVQYDSITNVKEWLRSVKHIPVSCTEGRCARLFIGKFFETTYFAFVVHHAYMDGLAVQVFMERWATLYSGVSDRSVSYGRPRGGDRRNNSTIRFWSAYLKDSRPARLPPLKTTAPPSHREHVSLGIEIPLTIRQRLHACSKKDGSCPFAVWALSLCSALELLTGIRDMALPTVFSGRTPGLAHEIGSFADIVYLRCKLELRAGRKSILDELIRDVQQVVRHQSTPRTTVEQVLGWTDAAGKPPDVLLAYTTWSGESVHFGSCSVHRLPLSPIDIGVPLSLDVTRIAGEENRGDRIVAYLSYLPCRMSRRQAVRIKREVLRQLDLWSQAAAQENGIGVQPPLSGWPERAIVAPVLDPNTFPGDPVDSLFDCATASPRRVAVISGRIAETYGALAARVRHLSSILDEAGVKRGDLVPVIGNSMDVATAWLAIWSRGASFVTLPPDLPETRLCDTLDAFAFTSVVVGQQVHSVMTISGRKSLQQCSHARDAKWQAAGNAEDEQIAYGCFTSGTTGRPRLALISRSSLLNRLQWMRSAFEPSLNGGRVVCLQTTPLEYDSAIWQIMWPILSGGTTVLTDRGAVILPNILRTTIRTNGVNVVDLVPSVLRELLPDLRNPGTNGDLSGLRHIILGGEALKRGDILALTTLVPNVQVTNLYGTTETTIGSVFHMISGIEKEIPLGKPIPGTWCGVVDNDHELLPAGVEGEIVLGGKCLGEGYWKDEAETKRKFISKHHVSLRFFCTGDRGVIDGDGRLYYLGRIDNQLKRMGVRVEIDNIERLISSIKGVDAAAVVPHSETGLTAFVTPTDVDVDRILARARAILSAAEVPTRIYKISSMPLTSMGKLDRRKLKEWAASMHLSVCVDATSQNERDLVRDVWRTLLGKANLSEDVTFMNCGANSLMMVEAATLLSARVGRRVPITALFTHPTIDALSKYLEREKANLLK